MAFKKKPRWLILLIINAAIIFLVVILKQQSLAPPSYDYSSSDLTPAAPVSSWLDNPPPEGGEVGLEDDLMKKNYYVIFDSSGSMADDDKLSIAQKAVREFFKQVPPEANLGLAIFDGRGLSERVALRTGREEVVARIDETAASGYTPLREALELAYAKLNAQAQRQLGYGEYTIVVITDGEATSGQEPDDIVDRILKESPVVIHTIGFRIGEDHSLNQPGRVYYQAAESYEDLSRGLVRVLAEAESFIVTDFNK